MCGGSEGESLAKAGTSVCRCSTGKHWLRPDAGTEEKAEAMTAPIDHRQDTAQRRKGVARTAWVVGAIALAIYVGFILSGVLGPA